MTYADIKTLFYNTLGDSEASPVWITGSMAMQFANEAVQTAYAAARHIEKRTNILLAADTAEYDWPSDMGNVWRVAYDGKAILPITQSQLRVYDEEWPSVSGTPRHYYLSEINRKIGLYPKPSSATTYSAFTQEFGAVVDTDDSADTFSQEVGIVVDVSDASEAFNQEEGELVQAISADELEVFYKATPAVIDSGDDVPDVPGWCWPYVLFSMLASAYAADTEIMDTGLSGYWSALAASMIHRLRVRAEAKLNKTWVAKYEGWNVVGRRYDLRFPDTIPSS